MENTSNFSHSILIQERKCVDIEGVKKLDSFDQNEFLVDTNMGYVHISGQNLTLGNMNMERGFLSIKGTINVVAYVGKDKEQSPQHKEGFFKKLFK